MTRLPLVLVALGVLAAAPATVAAQTAGPATPVVVGPRAFTVAELDAAARRARASDSLQEPRPAGADALITAEWAAREAPTASAAGTSRRI